MQSTRCPHCDYLNQPSASFCAACGARLAGSPPLAPQHSGSPGSPAGASSPGYAAIRRRSPPAGHRSDSALNLGLGFFAILCAGAAFLFLTLSLPVLNLGRGLLDGERYKEALRQQDVYNRFADLFAAQMALGQAALAREAQIDFRGFTAADWKFIAQELTTPQWVQAQVERLIDDVFAERGPGAPPPEMKVSLAEVIEKISGEAGFRIYKQVIQTKRACTLDDFFNMMDWMEGRPNGVLPICHIPPGLLEMAAFFIAYDNGDALIRDLIRELPEQLPSELALSDFFSMPVGELSGLLSISRLAAWVGVGLAVLALLLVFLAPLGQTLSGWLLLWGAPLALSGLVCLLIAWFAPSVLGGMIAASFRGTLTADLAGVLLAMGKAVIEPGARSLMTQAGGLLLVGFLMCVGSGAAWVLKKLR